MGQQREWAVFAFLAALMALLSGWLHAETPSAIIPMGIGAALISIPLWAIVGLGIFGGLIALINLARRENKMELSLLAKANAGIALGLVLKLVFPSLP